jgi:CRP/FNR family transcriptional regulator, cyclic AMP receptor protein
MARGIPHDVLRHFAQVPLFTSVSKKGLRAVAAAATEIDVPAGKDLVREGEHDRYLYVITRGTAVVTKSGRRLKELVPGDFFGELAFLSGAARSATVQAYTDLRVLVLGPRELDVIVQTEPAVARALLKAMAERVQQNDRSPTS